jgi:hypothetical protein
MTGGAWQRLIPDKMRGLNKVIAIDIKSTGGDTFFRIARLVATVANPICRINMTLVGLTSGISFVNTLATTAEVVPPNFNGIETYTAQVPFQNPLGAGAVLMTSNVVGNITQITVPPGLWTISASAGLNGTATVIESLQMGISTMSATLPSDSSYTTRYSGSVIEQWGNAITPLYVDISASTTYYLVAHCTFTSGTVAGSGRITAIRTR